MVRNGEGGREGVKMEVGGDRNGLSWKRELDS